MDPNGAVLANLLLTAFMLSPGLSYEFGVERQLGYRRTGIADRLLYFLLESIFLHAMALPVTIAVWAHWFREGIGSHSYGELLPLWPIVAAYVLLPLALGLAVGRAARERHQGFFSLGWLLGRDPQPTAWDYLFGSSGLTAIVRAQLTDGTWVAGVYGQDAESSGLSGYAASQSGPTPDLFLPHQLSIDPISGELATEPNGRFVVHSWGLLLTRGEVKRMEIHPLETELSMEEDTVLDLNSEEESVIDDPSGSVR